MLTTSVANNQCKSLLHFIDQNVFDAILRLPVETYLGKDKEQFEFIRKKAQEDKRKFHAYRTPQLIKKNFLKEVPADGMNKDDSQSLKYLNHLSNLPEIKKEFIELCKKLML